MIKKIRPIVSFLLYTCAAAAVLGAVPWLIGVACAAADPGAAVTAAATSFTLPEWIGIGLAAIAGIKAMVDGALAFFRYLAPKTANTIDDTIRDDLQLAHDKLDTLTTLVQGVAKPVVVSMPAPKTSQAGFARLPLLAVLGSAALFIVAMFSIPVVAGCAASQRETTIKTALVTVDSARDGFLAYDRAHEQQLVAEATSADDARAKLAAYQAKRAKVDPLFAIAYRSMAAAQLLNDDPSITSMQAAIVSLLDALKPFLGGK